jgi:recombination protein RecA
VLFKASDPKYIVDFIPTGIVPIDIILGGGIPRGRFVEVYGDYSTLKSYIGYKAIVTVQQQGGTAALVDTEHAYDPEWAQECGINIDDLILQRPETGELAFDAVEALIRSKLELIDFDSIASMLPQADQGKRLAKENAKIAAMASLMSLALRKITAPNERTAVFFVNQMRTDVGMTFGDPNKPTSGKALPYYASMRLHLKKTGKITKDVQLWNGEKLAPGKEMIGQEYIAILDKSKLNKPHRQIRFAWSLTDGSVDETAFFIGQAVELGYVEINGSRWKVRGSQKTINGRDAFAKYVHGNPEVIDQLRNRVMESHTRAAVPIPTQPRKLLRKDAIARPRPKLTRRAV